ncbi:hypothetical protein [Verrucomicrobium spinosum]|uniref:hypothetical protein n=1 Tax=Verrucomicrobium spinosum TaxID=2736 RepID=UPI00094660F5|nr:hypothetical protein [Verrucomicrobium spinosum]
MLTWVRFLAIGRSPAEAWSAVRGANGVPTGRLELALAEADGTKPVTGAGLVLEQEINLGRSLMGAWSLIRTVKDSSPCPFLPGPTTGVWRRLEDCHAGCPSR